MGIKIYYTVLMNFEINEEKEKSLFLVDHKDQYYVNDKTKFLKNEIITWNYGIDYRLDCEQREKYRFFKKYLTVCMYDIIIFLKIDNLFNENVLSIQDYYRAKNEIFNDDDFILYIIRNAYPQDALFTLPTKESLQEFSKRLHILLQPKIECAKRKLKIIKDIKKHPRQLGRYHGSSGKYEHSCFNMIEKSLGIKIQRHVIINQKIVDGYLKKLRLFIEFNEPHHYLDDGSLNPYDIKRMEDILKVYPNHTFYIIKRDDFLENFQTVTEKFKNLIESKKSELLMKVG